MTYLSGHLSAGFMQPGHGVRIKWALQKNVSGTCCIDIKTKADKEEEGRNNDCGEKPRK